MKNYKCGLVVGKFSPLHRGHIKVLNRADEECDHLIIVSYTNPLLGFSDPTRASWLMTLYPRASVIVPKSEQCPTNDASADVHREFTATVVEECTHLRPEVVFTSEDYGDGFADFLEARWNQVVHHEYVDAYWRYETPEPSTDGYPVPLKPISYLNATDIRADHSLMRYVPDIIRQTRTRRVCILGGESAGKTTLAQALNRVGYPWVPEYGRHLCEELGGVANLKYEHLLQIGQKQVELEDGQVNSVKARWVICDTSPLVTKFYSQELYGKVDPELDKLAQRKYDMTIVLGMSHGWHQDGDRMSPEFSQKQELWYWRQMSQAREDFTKVHFIDGPLNERIEAVLSLFDNYNYDN